MWDVWDVYKRQGRDCWRIFDGGTGSTLPLPCREDDDELVISLFYHCCYLVILHCRELSIDSFSLKIYFYFTILFYTISVHRKLTKINLSTKYSRRYINPQYSNVRTMVFDKHSTDRPLIRSMSVFICREQNIANRLIIDWWVQIRRATRYRGCSGSASIGI